MYSDDIRMEQVFVDYLHAVAVDVGQRAVFVPLMVTVAPISKYFAVVDIF